MSTRRYKDRTHIFSGAIEYSIKLNNDINIFMNNSV